MDNIIVEALKMRNGREDEIMLIILNTIQKYKKYIDAIIYVVNTAKQHLPTIITIKPLFLCNKKLNKNK